MKKLIFGMVFVFLMVCLYAQNTSDFEVQGNDDGTMTILNYKGTAKDIVIPEKIFNMSVTRLREGALSKKGLTKVTIPATITFIGDRAFSENQLVDVIIPETVEYIGNNAFRMNQLASIIIPDGVVYIGDTAFYENSLTSVSIGNGVGFIGTAAFSGEAGNNRITTITLGSKVKYIGNDAFIYHRASSITIPDNIVFIGSRAFQPYNRDSLTTITIGKYVMLGANNFGGAFYNNGNFDTIYQNNDKRAGKYAYNGNWVYTSQTGQTITLETVNEEGIGYSGVYVVQNKNGLVLDVYDNSRNNGAPIIMYSKHGSSNQQFRFELLKDNTYKITSIHSGKALSVEGASKSDTAKVQQWDYTDGPNQRWQIIAINNEHVKIVNVNSGKCLDIPANSSGEGTQLWQYVDNGTDAQRFQLVPVK